MMTIDSLNRNERWASRLPWTGGVNGTQSALIRRPWSRQDACATALCVSSAFTLIEIMIVVAILGIVMAISIPAINKATKRAPMVQTLKELREVFSNARARAIFDGSTKQVVFRPYERSFALAGGGPSKNGAGLSGTFDEHLSLEMLDINLMEFKDEELAVVNFYPNGTCDELTIVLRSDENEWRKVTLEVTTALASVTSVVQ